MNWLLLSLNSESDPQHVNIFVIFHLTFPFPQIKLFQCHNLRFVANRMLLTLISKSDPEPLNIFVIYHLTFPFPQIKTFECHNLTFVVGLLANATSAHCYSTNETFARHSLPFVANWMLLSHLWIWSTTDECLRYFPPHFSISTKNFLNAITFHLLQTACYFHSSLNLIQITLFFTTSNFHFHK